MKYPVFEPDFGDAEIRAVADVMRRGEISGVYGRSIPDFEAAFADYCGVAHGVAVANGTVALQLAARVAGVGPGDEVLVSASTNIASALAAYHNGAVTVPVDSEDKTWNLDITLLKKLISSKTKAIIVVHLLGNPVDMPSVMAIAKKYGLVVIEDCAEAHGAEWNGKKVGSFGHFSCFSFLSNKVITTGEGGMVLTNDPSKAEQLRYLRSLAFGKTRFYHEDPGYNFRLTAMQAAMGIVQTKRIEEIIRQKIHLYRRYQERLFSIRGLQMVQEPVIGRHVHWMVGIRVKKEFGHTRDELKEHLHKEGIDSRTFFCPLNQQPFLKSQSPQSRKPRPIADKLWEDGIYLPSTINLTDRDLDFITNKIVTLHNQKR